MRLLSYGDKGCLHKGKGKLCNHNFEDIPWMGPVSGERKNVGSWVLCTVLSSCSLLLSAAFVYTAFV